MSYVAEPYAQFVDDLLSALTGAEVRQRFVFLPEQEPFRLAAPGPVLPRTVRVFGQTSSAFQRFRPDVDWVLDDGAVIRWLAREDGTPAADAVWPDPGTPFFANYEFRAPGGVTPPLTDRNPGSVVRLLAESFGREYAVLSRQMEAVYRAGFLDTAEGRDLDQLVRLVGVQRRRASFAAGTAVFARSTPAPADVFIPAGVRLSTSEPPARIFETTEDRTLRRGDLTVEAPIVSLEPGPDGVVPAGVVTVIHRPILGIEGVRNPRATAFTGADEADEALRLRARRSLEAAGRATTGALLGALTTLPGLREKDIRLAEDPLASPGVVHVSLAVPQMDAAMRRRAMDLIEETRPVGVRFVHALEPVDPSGGVGPGPGGVPEEGGAPVSLGGAADEEPFMPVAVRVQLVPQVLAPGAEERRALERGALDIVGAFFEQAGIGDALVYNRLVADLMALEGVLDVALEWFPEADPEQPRHRNVFPTDPNLRPVAGSVEIEIGGRLVLIDVSVAIALQGAGLLGDQASNRLAARDEVETQLRERIGDVGAELTPDAVLGLLTGSESYTLTELHYEVNYVEAGVRIRQRDVTLPLSGLERPWIGTVRLAQGESA